jgi:hypothetical protein
LQRKREIAGQAHLILVYQMGKVGSSTVVRSLKAHNLLAINVHTFDPFFLRRGQKIFKTEFKATGALAKTLWDQQLIRQRLKHTNNGKRIKIITLVRDPIARNISHFFQWPNMIMEQTDSGYHLRSPVFNYDRTFQVEGIEQALATLFMTRFKQHEVPLVWFDNELKHNFDIDIYSVAFPKEKGFSICANGNTEVLVIKLEKLRSVAQQAFQEFLGLGKFELISANIGQEKETSSLYKQFLETIKLPSDYIDNMYNSRLAKHFYSNEELDAFRARWCHT